MTETHDRPRTLGVVWHVQRLTMPSQESKSRCEALYFRSPLAYMPGEELVCKLQYEQSRPEDPEPLCYFVKVIRLDVDGKYGYGILCEVQE